MPASLSFAKLIAPPTETAWSQIYHAGNLFALVSLTAPEERDLNAMGKDMFNAFESNFFSLEKKNLHTIASVLDDSLKDIPLSIEVSACIAFSKEAVLYLFLVGNGMILMKRGEKVGVILSEKNTDNLRKPLTSSGYLSHEDVVIMQTGAFQKAVTYEEIEQALEGHLPNDIVEKLSQTKAELPGDASVVTLMYQGVSSPDALTPAQEMRRKMQEESPLATDEGDEEEDDDEKDTKHEKHPDLEDVEGEGEEEEESDDEKDSGEEDEKTLDEVIHAGDDNSKSQEDEDDEEKPKRVVIDHDTAHEASAEDSEEESPIKVTRSFTLPAFKMPPRKVLIGMVALILLGLLLFSVFFSKQQTRSNESQTVYKQAFEDANRKYEEAEGLKNLNASLAQDDYKEAAQIINTALPKIEKGSQEESDLQSLLSKIEQNIVQADGAETKTESATLSDSPLLAYAVDKSASYIATDDDKEYALTSTAVSEGDEDIIENDDDWKSVAGMGAYNGNIYILDKNEGILKFSAGSDGFGKSSYFSGDAPSLSNAVSMGIDGSIYVLFSDGNIKKYTRGKEESFNVSELPSGMKSPKQLVTGVDMDSIYILDSGNSRIVKLNKDGVFQKAWKAEILGRANLIDISKSEDKAYILNGKNLSVMNLE